MIEHYSIYHRAKRALLCAWLCGMSHTSWASSLQHSIDAMINTIDPKINMGMMVVDLNSSELLYSRSVDKTFIPASNMKLFSDATALLALGPDYHFQTKLSTDATKIQDGILYGSLYLYFSGDPSLKRADLDALFKILLKLNVKRITGDVILVSNFADISPQPQGILPRDLNYNYGASAIPLIVNENRVTVTVNPSCRIGEEAIAEHSEPVGSFIIDNKATTVSGNHAGISVVTTDDNHLRVRGQIGQKQGAIQTQIPIKNPLSHAQVLIKRILQQQNVAIDGQVILGKMKPSMLLATHYSKPIVHIMADTLKPSDNLYANSLFLSTAAKIQGAPVNWADAQTVIKQYFQQQTGIDMHSAVLVDGSGLSRQNLLTPKQTVLLLSYLYGHFPLAYEYIVALPIAGQDGTLHRRFRKLSQKGLIRAKTGSMTGVISLSGYLYAANGHTLAFAIFINTRPGTSPNVSGRYRSLVDSLCDFLLRQKPEAVRQHELSAHPQAIVAFQRQITDTDKLQQHIAQWRRIEYALKQALVNQPITVIFRNNQLILRDHGTHMDFVWSILQKIGHKYPIAVTLESATAPNRASTSTYPQLLWIINKQSNHNRQWIIRESIA